MHTWAIISIVFNIIFSVTYLIMVPMLFPWNDSDQVFFGIFLILLLVVVIIRIGLLSISIKYGIIKNPTKRQQQILKSLGILSIFPITEATLIGTLAIIAILVVLFLLATQPTQTQRVPINTEERLTHTTSD